MKLMLLLLTVAIVASVSFGEDVVREETITASLESSDLVSILNVNGDISLEGWDSEEVEIVYVITCDNQEEMDAIDVLCDLSDGIACEVDYDEDWDESHSGEVTFMVKVPEDLELDYEIADVNGNIFMSYASGNALLDVVNGEIEASNFDGAVVIELVNGSVNTHSISELDEISVVNGDIICEVSELSNDIFLSGVNGEIILNLDAEAMVEIETVSGDIDLSDSFNAIVMEELVGAGAEFGEGEHRIVITTVSGDIEVND